jgi:hypothetical protein
MDNGTKLRTALRVAMSLYTAFMVWQATVAQMGYKWLTVLWAFLTIGAGWAVDALTTYFNQDYTVEGATGTKITREMKKLKDTQWDTVEEPADSYIEEEGEEHGEE